MRKLLWTALLLLATSSILQAQSPWIYSTYFGGPSSDTVQAVAPDPISGNLYVAGLTSNSGFPFTSGAPAQGITSAYLATFDPGGQLLSCQLFAATYFGGMHVDGQGQVYLALGSTFGGPARVVKVAHDGSTVFSWTVTGAGSFSPSAITADSAGNVLFCGSGDAAAIPVTSGAYKPSALDTAQFCSKVSSDGSQLLASTMFGPEYVLGRSDSLPTALATDATGDFIVAGTTPSSLFPVLGGYQGVDRRRNLYRMAPDENIWTTVDDGSLTSVKTLDFDPQNPNHAYAATDAGIMLSDDGAHTWHLSTTYGVNFTRILKVHPLNSQYMIQVDLGNNVNISRDGGSTWAIASSSFQSFAFVTGGPESIIPDLSAAGMFFVLQRADSPVLHLNVATGTATVIACPGDVFSISATASATPALYLDSDAGLYISTDGKTSTLVPNSSALFMTWVAPSNGNILYAEKSVPPQNVLVRSDDGGQTWHSLPNAPIPSHLWIDPQSPATVFIVNGEGLQRSNDSGETWTYADESLRNRAVITLTRDPGGQLWIGTSAGFNGYLMRISGDAKTLKYSTLIGGSGGTTINAIAVNQAGDVELAGSSASTDFPVTPVSPSTGRPALGYVMRVSQDGSQLDFERRIPAAPSAMTMDANGSLYLVGQTFYPGIPTTVDSPQPIQNVVGDGFWMVLDSPGNNIIRSSYLGGNRSDSINAVAALPGGKVFLAGTTRSTDFPVTGDAAQGLPGDPSGLINDGFITIGSLVGSPQIKKRKGQLTSPRDR